MSEGLGKLEGVVETEVKSYAVRFNAIYLEDVSKMQQSNTYQIPYSAPFGEAAPIIFGHLQPAVNRPHPTSR